MQITIKQWAMRTELSKWESESFSTFEFVLIIIIKRAAILASKNDYAIRSSQKVTEMKRDHRRWRGGESRLASHQYGPGSNPCINAIYGLSFLSVLPFAPRGSLPDTSVFSFPQILPWFFRRKWYHRTCKDTEYAEYHMPHINLVCSSSCDRTSRLIHPLTPSLALQSCDDTYTCLFITTEKLNH